LAEIEAFIAVYKNMSVSFVASQLYFLMHNIKATLWWWQTPIYV